MPGLSCATGAPAHLCSAIFKCQQSRRQLAGGASKGGACLHQHCSRSCAHGLVQQLRGLQRWALRWLQVWKGKAVPVRV